MYINFWYPVGLSEEINNEAPTRVSLLGMNFVAFRDKDGTPHVISDTCVHRGGALGIGKIQGDNVECPYHGWQFAGSGECKVIPSMPDQKIPGRAKVDSYPTQEKYGIVFAFLGDEPEETRIPLYEIENYDADGWRANKVKVFDVGAYYERSMENGLDPAHNEFVHASQGLPKMLLDTATSEDTDWGTSFHMYYGDAKMEMTTFGKEQEGRKNSHAGSWFHGPNVLVTSIFISEKNNFVQYLFEAPLSRNETRIYFINMRNCMLDPDMDESIMEVNDVVIGEDLAVLETLWPVRTPDNLVQEIMTPSDSTIVKFREWLKQWDAKGWRIDHKQMQTDDGDIAYAIPSPARRNSAGWVLSSIPLIEGK
jgi:phenylpropionate dioxygenase-like ring-hydroxylating dioxygenase large terminal subunit